MTAAASVCMYICTSMLYVCITSECSPPPCPGVTPPLPRLEVLQVGTAVWRLVNVTRVARSIFCSYPRSALTPPPSLPLPPNPPCRCTWTCRCVSTVLDSSTAPRTPMLSPTWPRQRSSFFPPICSPRYKCMCVRAPVRTRLWVFVSFAERGL